jgi:hypothetical protein
LQLKALLEVQEEQQVGPLELAQQATCFVGLAVEPQQEPQEPLEALRQG